MSAPMAGKIEGSKIEHVAVTGVNLSLCGRVAFAYDEITRPVSEVPTTRLCQHCRNRADEISAAIMQAAAR